MHVYDSKLYPEGEQLGSHYMGWYSIRTLLCTIRVLTLTRAVR
jgi:hypothetical protein